MGSYYDRLMECYWCGRPGQCCLDATEPLLDVDAWGGVFCLPCYRRGYPPHYDYLLTLFDIDWNVAVTIAQFTYPVCSDGDYVPTDEGLDENLFLARSHREALFLAGYNDDGFDLSEGFLDRRRGAYAHRRRMMLD